MVLGLGDNRVVGREGAGGAGVGENCTSGMDGSKEDNAVISMVWKCLLLCRISLLGGAFEQERVRKKYKGGGRVLKRF